MNAEVRDHLLYLKDAADDAAYSGAQATTSVDQNITTSVSTNIFWNGADNWDVGTWHTVGDSGLFVPDVAFPTGATTIAVRLEGTVYWEGNATGLRGVSVMRSGVEVGNGRTSPANANAWSQYFVAVTSVVKTDSFTIRAIQTSGVSIAVQSGSLVHIQVVGVLN